MYLIRILCYMEDRKSGIVSDTCLKGNIRLTSRTRNDMFVSVHGANVTLLLPIFCKVRRSGIVHNFKCRDHTGVTVSFFPPPVFPRGRIRPAHFFPGEETD